MSRSARQSNRVDPAGGVSAGQRAVAPSSAPESMALLGMRGSGSAERRPRVSGEQLQALSSTLSDRDRAVLRSVRRFGFLRSHHLEQMHFTDHSTSEAAARICRRTLQRLQTAGLLDTLQRRIGGLRAGSASSIWRLTAAGHRLLRQREADAPRPRRKEPSLRFLAHRLTVADCYCRLLAAERAGLVELLSAEPEPASWRPFTGRHGAREVLKPDLAAVTATPDYEDHWFIEADLGTESLPTVLRQCQQYERYRLSGDEQQAHGLFPRVIWLVPDERRRDRVRTGIDRAKDLDSDLFVVALYSDLEQVMSATDDDSTANGGDVGATKPSEVSRDFARGRQLCRPTRLCHRQVLRRRRQSRPLRCQRGPSHLSTLCRPRTVPRAGARHAGITETRHHRRRRCSRNQASPQVAQLRAGHQRASAERRATGLAGSPRSRRDHRAGTHRARRRRAAGRAVTKGGANTLLWINVGLNRVVEFAIIVE
jgi:hypothetical protein